MRVNVFGPGGVGGYVAARLAASGMADVSTVARGAHLDAIRREGLRLTSPHGDEHVELVASDDPEEIGPVDVILLTVKATDVPQASRALDPLMGPDTVVVTLQNGVESPKQVAEVVGKRAVFPGVAYIFSTVEAPGVIRHTAGPGRFVFGEWSGLEPTGRAAELGDFLSAAGVANDVVDDVDVALWSKFVIICSTAGATAPSRLPIDALREHPSTWQLFEDLARETFEVGRAAGVAMPDDVVDRALEFIFNIGPDAYSSLLYDLVNGKPMELETLHGTVVRLGEEHGLDVPVSRTIYALLAPWARRNSSPGSVGGDEGSKALMSGPASATGG